jgi:membrane protein YqaA with SNARE-associated domain
MCTGRWALPAFGLVSALESSILPIPTDAVMVPLAFARPNQLVRITVVATIGSVVGAVIGYGIGAIAFEAIGDAVLEFYGMEQVFTDFVALYRDHGWLALLGAALTPVPFKLAAIVSGLAGLPFWTFLMVCVVGRFLRFSLTSIAVRFLGSRMRSLIEKNPQIFYGVMTAMMIGGLFLAPLLL